MVKINMPINDLQISAMIFDSATEGILVTDADNCIVTIGMAIYTKDGDVVEQLLKSADNAMYTAKSKGHSFSAFSSAESTS